MFKAMNRMLKKGRGANFAMLTRCESIRVFNPHMRCRLFDSLVNPILSYGAQIWGPDIIVQSKGNLLKGDVEDLHRCFMRMVLGACKATPLVCMMSDLDRHPIMVSWIQDICRLWNSILQRDPSDILLICLKDNIRQVNSWGQKVIQILNLIGRNDISLFNSEGSLNPIDDVCALIKTLKNRYREKLWEPAQNLAQALKGLNDEDCSIRNCPDHMREGFKILKYKKWFAHVQAPRRDQDDFQSNVSSMLFRAAHIRTLTAFRCGVHWLCTETMRSTGLGRSERVCPCCDLKEREDEMHVFKCMAYKCIHYKFPLLFGDKYATLQASLNDGLDNVDILMNRYMNGRGKAYWQQLADFLIQSRNIRDDKICARLQSDNTSTS
jgi:hypothetical protein